MPETTTEATPKVTPEMTNKLWGLAHMLAADLALNRVSKNLVQDVITYVQHYPDTPVLEYAARLQQLSETGHFQAGKSGPYEREDLYTALHRVKTWPDAVHTRLLLAWVARLMDYYATAANLAEAIRRSRLPMHELAQGQPLTGKVRETDQRYVWVRVYSGQWGRAQRRGDVDIGDEVEVNVRRVTDKATFDVDIVAVTRRAPRPQPVTAPASTPAPAPEIPAERDEEIKEAAEDFMAFLRKKWGDKSS
jgi:hypothetical protein